MRFHAILQLNGKTATGIEVPSEVVEALSSGKKPPVRVTIAGHTYRTTLATRNGKTMLPVSGENRSLAGIAAGDPVEVDLELDTEPREVRVPNDFAAALEREPEAKGAFERLSYSAKQRHTLPIEAAKQPETRQRRIDKSIESLRLGR
jgi:hypothetical protein